LCIAELLGRLGEHRESIHACTLALDTKFDPELVNFFYRVSYNLRAEQYLKLGQKNNAKKDLKRALKYSNNDIDIVNKIREIDGYDPISDPTKKQNELSNADSSKTGHSKS
jgi:tetratricopeptide (TPR) repeat protein